MEGLNNLGFSGGLEGKESACKAGDLDLIPGLGRSPGEGNGYPLQYSCLENPTDQRSLAGYSSQGCKESDMIERRTLSFSLVVFDFSSQTKGKGKKKNKTPLMRRYGSSLMVQWLRLHTPNAGVLGLIPSQGTRSHMLQLRIHTLQVKIPRAVKKTEDPECCN